MYFNLLGWIMAERSVLNILDKNQPFLLASVMALYKFKSKPS